MPLIRTRPLVLCAALAAAVPGPARADYFWKNTVPSGNWSNPNNWSAIGPLGADNAGVPPAGAGVRILTTDASSHTITFDGQPLSLGFVTLGGLNGATNTLSLSSGTLSAGEQDIGWSGFGGANGSATFNHSGGTNTLGATGMYIGVNPSDRGTYNLSANALFSAAGSVLVGSSGTGTFNHSGGTATFANTAPLYLGYSPNSSGSYFFSAGTLITNAHTIVGREGRGFFQQTGGIHSSFRLNIASESSGVGNYHISAGTLTTGLISVGGSDASTAGAGTLTITGGVVSAVDDLTTHITGATLLSGGTLSVGRLFPSNIHWSGGTLEVRSRELDMTSSGAPISFNLANGQVGRFTGTSGGDNAALVLGGKFNSVFTQSGLSSISVGTDDAARNLYIGATGFPFAHYLLSHPSASLAVKGSILIGKSSSSIPASRLEIAGGAVHVSDGIILFESGGVHQSGGTLTAGFLRFEQPFLPHHVWTGGTLNITTFAFHTDLLALGGEVSVSSSQAAHFTGRGEGTSDLSLVGLSEGTLLFVHMRQTGGDITVGTPALRRDMLLGGPNGAIHTLEHADSSLTVYGDLTFTPSPAGGTLALTNGNVTVAGRMILGPGLISLTGGTLRTRSLEFGPDTFFPQWTGGRVELTGGALLGIPQLTVPASGTLSGNGSIQTNLTLNGTLRASSPVDPLTLHGTTAGPGNAFVHANALLVTDALRINALSLAPGSTARIRPSTSPNASTSKLNALDIAGTHNAWLAKLDLFDNALILQSLSPSEKAARLPTLLNQVATKAITSSTIALNPANLSLALADNAALGYTSFRGQPVDANSLLITSALFGDANLDQTVDAFDLNLLAAHWQQPAGALWSDGDFTGDGAVDAFDLNLLAAHWQSTTSLLSALLTQDSAPSTQNVVPIPEPSSLALLALPLLFRRRIPRAPG